MLILTRKSGQTVVVYEKNRPSSKIEITVLGIQGQRIRLGIEGSSGFAVLRKEIHDRVLPADDPSGSDEPDIPCSPETD